MCYIAHDLHSPSNPQVPQGQHSFSGRCSACRSEPMRWQQQRRRMITYDPTLSWTRPRPSSSSSTRRESAPGGRSAGRFSQDQRGLHSMGQTEYSLHLLVLSPQSKHLEMCRKGYSLPPRAYPLFTTKQK